MGNSAIEDKLLEATGLKKSTKGDRQAYLRKIVNVVQTKADDEKTGDEFWDSLMDEDLGDKAQVWVNAGTKLLEKATEAGEDETTVEIEDFPDIEDGDMKDKDEKTEKSAKKAKPADKKAAKEPAKKVAAKPDKKAAKEKEPAKKAAKSNGKDAPEKSEKKAKGRTPSVGAYTALRDMLYDDPTLKTDELVTKLAKKNLEPSKLAVSTIRSQTLNTLRELKARGNLKGIDI